MERHEACGMNRDALVKNNHFVKGSVMHSILYFIKDEEGATAIEYGVLSFFIALTILGGVYLMGMKVKDTFAVIEGQFYPTTITEEQTSSHRR